ncbi:hypothetical protein Theth_0287 [Pseudothermotoga thermarum DSM 5069]|uniref:Uncharacterized protein n=1 Tax=Pseudothermotoga thermarum DSM 5069 TaxID=688269 RepID=F7YV87_9THEM|nr:hypothetical protein Theth_0287 [Pseudothermotoga thermarum DSM 5069]
MRNDLFPFGGRYIAVDPFDISFLKIIFRAFMSDYLVYFNRVDFVFPVNFVIIFFKGRVKGG